MALRVFGILAIVALLGAALFYSRVGEAPLEVSGLIEADEIRVGSRIGGRVRSVAAVEGSQVKAGELLVELEPFDLLEKRAEIEKTLEARKAEFALIESGFRSEDVGQAKAHRDQLAARLDKLEHGPRSQEIAVGEAQLSLSEAESNLAQLQFDRAKSLLERNAITREEMDRVLSELKKTQAQVQIVMFPRNAMPLPIYLATFAIPATYFLEILRGIVLRDADFIDLVPQVIGLAICCTVILALSLSRCRKQLA